MASSLFPNRNSQQHSNASGADGGLLQRFQAFAQGITPQEAEKRLNALLASGQISKSQLSSLANQARQFMRLLGLK